MDIGGNQDDWLSSLGFPPILTTNSLRSIAHLFPNKKKRCGIYLIELSNDVYYIGQSKEVVRRYAAHLKAHEQIFGISFLPVAAKELDAVERELIFKAQQIGIVLANNTHVAHVIGEADLDLVVPRVDQEAWLNNSSYRVKLIRRRALFLTIIVAAFKRQHDKLLKSAYHHMVIKLLRTYISRCIIFPVLTEYSFWSVSCCPSTNRHTRLAAVNAGMMELFVLGFYPQEPNAMCGFINVAESVLDQDVQLIDLLVNEGLSPTHVAYRDAADDCCRIDFTVGKDDWILRDQSVMGAAAELALRVMRKRSTIYCKYHCKQLADEVLSGFSL
ncbi:MAG: GIY-YIG nuclease family protein [Rhodospirillales bacterium]|nr:GIY-YIG nuclease family protein [Rhodospirillales bacterium]